VDRCGQQPERPLHKGDDVEAIILSINHDEKKVSLGIKQLYEDPWSRIRLHSRFAVMT
jgi:ribosomal protein S1